MPQIAGKNILLETCIALAVFVLLISAGCSDPNTQVTFDPLDGHPGNWVDAHGSAARSESDQCIECHGGDLQGGTSDVSCFASSFDGTSCHGVLVFHGTGWDNSDVHGPPTKAAPDASTGFESCKECHGDDYAGGIMQVSCFTAECHGVDAPHPPEPWLDSPGTHIDTDEQNAEVCAECHRDESEAGIPLTTAAGCFNNTLCHAIPEHTAGWETSHSLDARVSTESCGTANCHGTDFTGGDSGISCFECHLGGPSDPGLGGGIMHPSGWTDPENDHEDFLDTIGGDATSCSPTRSGVALYCHGDGLPNDTNLISAPPNGSWTKGPTCWDCHDDLWTAP